LLHDWAHLTIKEQIGLALWPDGSTARLHDNLRINPDNGSLLYPILICLTSRACACRKSSQPQMIHRPMPAVSVFGVLPLKIKIAFEHL